LYYFAKFAIVNDLLIIEYIERHHPRSNQWYHLMSFSK